MPGDYKCPYFFPCEPPEACANGTCGGGYRDIDVASGNVTAATAGCKVCDSRGCASAPYDRATCFIREGNSCEKCPPSPVAMIIVFCVAAVVLLIIGYEHVHIIILVLLIIGYGYISTSTIITCVIVPLPLLNPH